MRKFEYYINVLHYVIYAWIRKLDFLLLGIPDIASARIMYILSLVPGVTLFIIIDKLLNNKLDNLIVFAFMLPFGLLVYCTVLHNDKYEGYFKEFENESKEVKRKWAFISFVVIVVIILLLPLSFAVYVSN